MTHTLMPDGPLTEEQVRSYRENGFIQIDNVLSEGELSEFREYMDEAMSEQMGRSPKTDREGGIYYKVLNQKVNTWRDHLGMARYTSHPRFANMALQLAGFEGIRLFHDHTLWKMPGDSKPTPWHQDTVNWPMRQAGALSIWIALDDVDETNGCMMFIPKSRNIGRLPSINLVEPQDIRQYFAEGQVDMSKPVIARMKAGSCTFHDGLTFHYAYSNRTDKPRRAFAIIYMADGTTYSGQPHICTDGLNLQEGQPLQGSLFPLLARQPAEVKAAAE